MIGSENINFVFINGTLFVKIRINVTVRIILAR